MLECTEVPRAPGRHMYDQIRIVQRKRQTLGGGLATQSKFAVETQYNTEPECTCRAAGSEFTRIGEHVCMRVSEYKGKHSARRTCLWYFHCACGFRLWVSLKTHKQTLGRHFSTKNGSRKPYGKLTSQATMAARLSASAGLPRGWGVIVPVLEGLELRHAVCG